MRSKRETYKTNSVGFNPYKSEERKISEEQRNQGNGEGTIGKITDVFQDQFEKCLTKIQGK